MRSETKKSLILMLLLGSIFFPITSLVRGIDTHSLTVTLDNLYFQNHLESNTTMSLRMTIGNNGDVTEQNISFQLLINGSQPLNTTVDQLAPQKNCSSSYQWTPEDGLYNLTAYVFTSFANESETKWVNVCKSSLPQPAFAVWPISGWNTVTEDANITFNASNCTNPDGASITLYYWKFGSSQPPENDTFPTTFYSFSSAGMVTVTLTIYDSDGFSNSTSKILDVTANPTADFSIRNPDNCRPPRDQSPYYVNRILTFDASASLAAPDAKILSYVWDFGDNNRNTGKTVFHSYSYQSNYTVMLYVTDSNGLNGSKSLAISLNVGSPMANFTISPGPYYLNNIISFDASGSYDPDSYTSPNAGIANYTWNFDDNSTPLTGQKVTRHYSSIGNYTLSLTVTDRDNLTGFMVKTLQVVSQTLVIIEDVSSGNYTDISYDPGDTFSVNVRVIHVEELDYYSFTLECASSAPFSLLAHGNLPLNLTGDLPLNMTDIKNSGSVCQITVASNQSLGRVKGNFTLATIPFNVTCPGNFTLRLISWSLLNSLGNPIPNVLTPQANFYTEKPVAQFWVDKGTPAPKDLVTFNGSDSYDPHHTSDYHHGIIHYKWDFGDGNITDTNAPPTMQHTYMTDGNYNVILTVWDSQGEQCSTLPVPIIVKEIHDVAVTGLTLAAADVSNVAHTVTLFNITVNIVNKGNVNETFNVMVYDNDSYAANITLSVPPHSQTQAVFCNSTHTGWNVTGLIGIYMIYANASVAGTVPSGIIAIKTLQLGVKCDLDGNGKAGLIELVILANAYNSNPTSPKWNPTVDFNGDGNVNLADLVILALNYGK